MKTQGVSQLNYKAEEQIKHVFDDKSEIILLISI